MGRLISRGLGPTGAQVYYGTPDAKSTPTQYVEKRAAGVVVNTPNPTVVFVSTAIQQTKTAIVLTPTVQPTKIVTLDTAIMTKVANVQKTSTPTRDYLAYSTQYVPYVPKITPTSKVTSTRVPTFTPRVSFGGGGGVVVVTRIVTLTPVVPNTPTPTIGVFDTATPTTTPTPTVTLTPTPEIDRSLLVNQVFLPMVANDVFGWLSRVDEENSQNFPYP